MLGLVILVVSVLVSLGIGGLVFFGSSKTKVHVVYGILTLEFLVLAVANYLTLETSNDQLLFVRLVMGMTSLVIGTTFFLIAYLLHPSYRWRAQATIVCISSVVVACIDLSGLLFTGVVAGVPPRPLMGIFAPVFFVHLISVLGLTMIALIKMIRRSTGDVKRQYIYVLAGITPTLLFSPLTGYILPFTFGIGQLIVLTPLYIVVFVAFIGYAIARHKLFDIKMAAVRTTAYVATLASLGVIYYGLAYLLSAILFQGKVTEGISFSPVNIMLALFLALIFQPFKKFFDKITNSYFFRNDYNPQKALDEVGAIVAKQIQLQPLLRDSLNIIRKTLNPSSANFLLVGSDLRVGHVQGFGVVKNIEELLPSLSRCKRQLIVATTEIPESPGLHDMLDGVGVSVVIRLDTANRIGGYLILADKLNGLAYSRRDLDFLSVMTDELAVAIENAQRYEEIQAFNKTLQAKVDEATSELKTSNHKLHELDKTKDEFISMASHQLRTPLTTIKGYISMLLDGDAGEVTAQQRKLLEEAFNSSQRMVYLIGDFLNVSRIQTGKFAIELAPCNLSSILDEEIEQLQVIAASRQLDLSYDQTQNFPTLDVDENKIRQVMMNFVDNAIYYSKPGGKIRIVLSYDRDHIEFKVVDNGIGVPKAEQHKLFTKFSRASNARKQRPDGTGIGLFMAKKVIVALGGSIIFKSEEGKGSTFGFSLNR